MHMDKGQVMKRLLLSLIAAVLFTIPLTGCVAVIRETRVVPAPSYRAYPGGIYYYRGGYIFRR
jgi:hypothetical protein